MEFGSKEWFEKMEEKVEFPNKFSFYYSKKKNSIYACILSSKAKVNNVRWEDLNPVWFLSLPYDSALITVKEIDSTEQYHEEMVDLLKEWEATVG